MIRKVILVPAAANAVLTMASVAPAAGDSVDGSLIGSQRAMVSRDSSLAFVPEVNVLHDYGDLVLINFVSGTRPEIAQRAHLLPSGDVVGFRAWRGTVSDTAVPPSGEQGLYIVNLIGPLDQRWRTELENSGVEILAPAHPHALVVRADGVSLHQAMRIHTSEDIRVIRGILSLPIEARVHRSLVPVLRGEQTTAPMDLVIRGFSGDRSTGSGRRAQSLKRSRSLGPTNLARYLSQHPEIGYLEPTLDKEAHNNLAARTGLIGAEPVWDLGYNGRGIVISHNDSGVDLAHPDLIDAVTASFGRMEYADTAHGTHTAGSIVGRGTGSAPTNTSGCGDLTVGLPTARGMAWGAAIVTNNIFEEGYDRVTEMMAWGVRHDARVSSNSWGLLGSTAPEVGYSAAAVEADAAVRDADPDEAGLQPLAIFFSAGNTGPDPGTVTSPGTAKNVITIGAAQNDRCGAWVPGQQPGPDPETVLTASGRGPSQGRVKPDLTAPGSDVLSVGSGDSYAVQPWDESWTGSDYALNTGTSQACALAAGAGTVLHEALWRTYGLHPSPALLKAALIVSADTGVDGVDGARGWGGVDLERAVSGPDGGSVFFVDQQDTAELIAGSRWIDQIFVRSASAPLAVAVVWTDIPGEEDADHPLVNDLDLVLTAPSGDRYRGNVFSGSWSVADPVDERDMDNNVEVVRVESPEVGTWILEVVGVDVPEPPPDLQGQDFALAVSGEAGPCGDPPPPPATVEAQRLGDNQIRIDWSAVSGATRYEVSRSTIPGGQPYEPVATVPAGVGSRIDSDVSGGTEYHYVVRADRDCWSGYSVEASATAAGACRWPPVFDGLASVDETARTGCSLELGWEPAEARCPGVPIYTIYRGDEPGFQVGEESRLLPSLAGTRWLDQGLESGRDYYYVVRAWHHGQEFDDGNTVEIKGRPSGPDDVYLVEDVEGDVSGWIRGPGSEADSGTQPWGVTEDDAWTGVRAFFVADEISVKDQVLQIAEPIALPEETEPILEFSHRFRLEKAKDGGRLEYSTNGGLDWHDILDGDDQTVPDDPQRWRNGGYTGTIGALSNPLFPNDGWTGDSRGWVHSRVDLSDFAGRRLLLRWRMGCDETPGLAWGWWLDEIRLVIENDCLPCLVSEPEIAFVAEPSQDGVRLEWEGHPFDDAYRVSRASEPEGPYQVLGVVESPESTYVDGSASGGSRYFYAMAIGFDECWTDRSSAVAVTAGGPCKLAPGFWGLDRVIDRREAGCALDLEWRQASPGCAGAGVGYRIYRSQSAFVVPGPESLIADGVAGPRYRDLTVADGVLYHYLVGAVDDSSSAEETNTVEHSGWTTGPQEVHFSDSMEGDLSRWVTAVGSDLDSGTEPWGVVNDRANTGSRSWFCSNEPRVKDQLVILMEPFEIVDSTTVLSFFHHFDLEPFWDGGRLEYSTDDGASWHDILDDDGATVGENEDRFIRGGYTGFMSPGTGNPLGGERGWTGFTTGWAETVVDLGDLVGLTVRFRWRLGCDRSDARLGWWLDDVELRTTNRCESIELPPPRPVRGRLP